MTIPESVKNYWGYSDRNEYYLILKRAGRTTEIVITKSNTFTTLVDTLIMVNAILERII